MIGRVLDVDTFEPQTRPREPVPGALPPIAQRYGSVSAHIALHSQVEGLRMGKTVTFNRPDGQIIHGYLAEPEHAEGAAAVVVIQEWWGINDQIRGVADRLASTGYIALVPDLYRGKSTAEA